MILSVVRCDYSYATYVGTFSTTAVKVRVCLALYVIVDERPALYPLRSLATSVLIHFGPFYKDRTDKGPKWQRTEVDVQIGTKDRSG